MVTSAGGEELLWLGEGTTLAPPIGAVESMEHESAHRHEFGGYLVGW